MTAVRSPLIWIPSLILVLLIGGYTVYWSTLKQDVLDGVAQWAEDRRADGMDVSYADANVSGFPFRMDLRIDTLAIADPQHPNKWSWTGENVDVELNPFRLTEVDAYFKGQHRFTFVDSEAADKTTPNELLSTADKARVSLLLGRDKLKNVYTEIDGWQGLYKAHNAEDYVPVTARKYRMQVETAPQDPTERTQTPGPDTLENQTMLLQIEELQLPPGTFPPLGDLISLVEAKTEMRNLPSDFQRADDRDEALKRWATNNGSLEIDAMHMMWGDLDLTAEGTLQLDRQYRLKGAVTTLADGYDAVIDGLVDQGQLDATLASLIKSALNLIALTGKDPKGRLRIPLDMRAGGLYLGPLKLTNLPPLIDDEN